MRDSNDVFAKMHFVSYDNYTVWADHHRAVACGDGFRKRAWVGSQTRPFLPVAEQLIGAQEHDTVGHSRSPIWLSPGQHKFCCTGHRRELLQGCALPIFGQEEFCYGVL